MICSKCGNQIPENSAFCPFCGEKSPAAGAGQVLGGQMQGQQQPAPTQQAQQAPVQQPTPPQAQQAPAQPASLATIPAASIPPQTQPSYAQPVSPQTQPSYAQPMTAQAQPSYAQPASAQPSYAQPSPAGAQPTYAQPAYAGQTHVPAQTSAAPIQTMPGTPLPENPFRAIILAGAALVAMLYVGISTSGWSWESEFTIIFQAIALASAVYLIQKPSPLYRVAAGAIGLLAAVFFVVGFFLFNAVSSGGMQVIDPGFLMYVFKMVIREVIVAAAVIGAGLASTLIVKGDTRKQTTYAALFAGFAYIVFTLIMSFILFFQGFAETFVIAGIGSIPEAIACGVAVKLVSMLCLFRSTRLELTNGPKIWFALCFLFTLGSLITMAMLPGQFFRPAWGFSVYLLTVVGIVGYAHLFFSRRVGYILVLAAVGCLFFGQFGHHFTAALYSFIFGPFNPRSLMSMLTCLTMVINPTITGIVLFKAWKTTPAEPVVDKKRPSIVFIIGALAAVVLASILLANSLIGFFNPYWANYLKPSVFFLGPLLWTGFVLVAIFATISCFYKKAKAPKLLMIAGVAVAVISLLMCVLSLVMGSTPYTENFGPNYTYSHSSSQPSTGDTSGSGQNFGDGPTDTPSTPDSDNSGSTSGNPVGLPLTVSAFGNGYLVNSFSIDTNSSGNTVLTIVGSGFDVLPLRNGVFHMPLDCRLVVGGSEKDWFNGLASGDHLEFEFDGTFSPDTLIIMPGDDESVRYEFPAN